MATQGTSTAQLNNASREMIKEAIYTAEHNAPNKALVRTFTLEPGNDTMVVPKVGQMTMLPIAEAEKNTNEMDIGMTTQSVTTSIVGGKVILTDAVLRDSALELWTIAGQQVGDAKARRMERDIIALYPSLNGGTSLGGAGTPFNAENVVNVITHARINKFGLRLHIIHHPSPYMRLVKELSTIGSGGSSRPIPRGYSEDLLRDFFDGVVISGVPIFQTGEVDRDTNNDAIGVIKQRDALGLLQAGEFRRRKVRDESIGEGVSVLYVTHRYSVFEMDDTKGAALTHAAATPGTT